MVSPWEVTSPKQRWQLIDALIEQPTWSLAIGRWDRKACLACRWNGQPGDHAKGNPVSRGQPTWFVLPHDLDDAVLSVVPDSKMALVKAVLTKQAA